MLFKLHFTGCTKNERTGSSVQFNLFRLSQDASKIVQTLNKKADHGDTIRKQNICLQDHYCNYYYTDVRTRETTAGTK